MITAELAEARELEDRDVQAILARNITGRIAFNLDGEIEIRPVSYVYADGTIYLRSAATASLALTDPDGTVVGFEVDEIHSMSRWSSIVVRGTLFRISRSEEQEAWMQGVARLRRLIPEALRSDDRLAHRSEIFRIVIRQATGRAMV